MTESLQLNPQDFLSIVTDVQVLDWGSQLLVFCLDDPVDRQAYTLFFKNCREIRWQVHDPDGLMDNEADLLGVSIGKDKFGEPAIITTDSFEVSVLYEYFEIKKHPIPDSDSGQQDS